MKISGEGIQFIKNHEGCSLVSYKDGGDVWTIGIGHTQGVLEGQRITKEEADEMLKSDLTIFESSVNKNVKVSLNQNQFDALVSLTFNIGCNAFKQSTLLSLLNSGEMVPAADQFMRWVYDNGQVVQGLYNRREKERELFLSKMPS